jgi:DMSO/TMAO reductase YedYZ molybdopterin-dependent catalytic subunit
MRTRPPAQLSGPARALPAGQRACGEFARFGLPRFAARWPDAAPGILRVTGAVDQPLELLTAGLAALPRREQTADLHCVTTWTAVGLRWEGVLFGDFYERVVVPRARPHLGCSHAVLTGLDGYRTSLPLEDLLAPGVLLADQLDGQPLPAEHGAPLRLVAPRHYGYKSVKHLTGIALRREPVPGLAGWKEHPRGRVALEERGQVLPGWAYRWLLRAVLPAYARWFRRRSAASHPQRRQPGPP